MYPQVQHSRILIIFVCDWQTYVTYVQGDFKLLSDLRLWDTDTPTII
jgi:hypothetical protein